MLSPMAFAITALDVAFVSSIAALVSVIVAPASAWLIARGGRSHERRLAQDERIFESRSKIYEDVVRDGRRDARTMKTLVEALWELGKEDEPDEGERDEPDEDASDKPEEEEPDDTELTFGTAEEWVDLETRMLVFGSEPVVEKYLKYRDAMGELAEAGRTASLEPKPDAGRVDALRVGAVLRLTELEGEMRKDLRLAER